MRKLVDFGMPKSKKEFWLVLTLGCEKETRSRLQFATRH
jgi:hypothetical protein